MNDDVYNKLCETNLIIEESSKDFFQSHTHKNMLDIGNVSGRFDDEAIITLITSYADSLLKVAKNNLEFIAVGYIDNGDYQRISSMKKSDFARRAIKIAQAGKLDNNIKALKVVNKLADITAPLKADLPKFNVSIDNNKYSFNSKLIMQFLIDGYKKDDFKNEVANILGLSIDKSFYVLKAFIKKNKLKEKFIFDEKSQRFMDEVLWDIHANTFHFNKLLSTTDENLEKVKLDENFVKQILNGIPNNYSLIEKAIYVYIKLCKELTYDAEFYANNQKGMTALKHKDIKRLETINQTNNQIVCYEFTQIYAGILNKLGINYEIMGSHGYGYGHNSLALRVNDFIVSADSVTSILGGDLYNAKINNNLLGLICKNKNKQTIALFNKLCRKVYQNIIINETSKQTDEDSLKDFFAMFDALCVQEEVTQQQKKNIFEKQCKQTAELPTTEKISHLLRIAKGIFSQEKKQEKFDITVITRKKIQGIKITSEPIIILAFNENTFKKNPKLSSYFIVQDDDTLKELSQEEIIKNFNSGMFKYISGSRDHIIPGLEMEGQNVK